MSSPFPSGLMTRWSLKTPRPGRGYILKCQANYTITCITKRRSKFCLQNCSSTAKFSGTKSEAMGVKRPRDFVLTLEEDDAISQSESEPEVEESTNNTKKRKTDEDLNPDFEFDGFDMLEGVKGIDDDGWGFEGVTGMRQGAGVDLDGIIARRRENLADNEDEEEVDEEEEEGDEDEKQLADDSEPESDSSEEFNGFDDDEEIGTFYYFLANVLS
jgi:hypothetical protein